MYTILIWFLIIYVFYYELRNFHIQLSVRAVWDVPIGEIY